MLELEELGIKCTTLRAMRPPGRRIVPLRRGLPDRLVANYLRVTSFNPALHEIIITFFIDGQKKTLETVFIASFVIANVLGLSVGSIEALGIWLRENPVGILHDVQAAKTLRIFGLHVSDPVVAIIVSAVSIFDDQL